MTLFVTKRCNKKKDFFKSSPSAENGDDLVITLFFN